MATNPVQEGRALTVAAPTGGAVSGTPFQVVDFVGVPVASADAGDPVAIALGGVYSLPKSGSSGPVFAVGDAVHWTGSVCTTLHTHPRIGTATAAAGASATSVDVLISTAAPARPVGRLTAAGTQLNTGATALAAHADTLTIPAGTLRTGDMVKILALVKVDDNNSTNTLTCNLRFGGSAVADQAAHDVDDNDIVLLEATVFVVAGGASGSVAWFGRGQVQDDGLDADNAGTASLDLSGAIVIDVAATWSGAHADNKTTLKGLFFEVIR
jgi:predicted RecA/RadA family phage recombinase